MYFLRVVCVSLGVGWLNLLSRNLYIVLLMMFRGKSLLWKKVLIKLTSQSKENESEDKA